MLSTSSGHTETFSKGPKVGTSQAVQNRELASTPGEPSASILPKTLAVVLSHNSGGSLLGLPPRASPKHPFPLL